MRKENKNKLINYCWADWNYCELQLTPYKIHCYSKLVAKQSARETNILLYLHPNTRPTVQHLSPVTLPYMLIFLQSYADETSALYLLEEIVNNC